MPLFKKKTTAPSTETRALAAHALATGALSVFHDAAGDLELAHDLIREVATEVSAKAKEKRAEAEKWYQSLHDEANELETQVDHMIGNAIDHLNAADKIRSLFS